MQGLIDLTYAPHIIQPLSDLSPQSPVRVVYFVCGTQLAKSTMNLIYIAYRIDCHLRGPILAMHAIKDMALAWAKDELQETITSNQYISDVLERVGRKNDPYLFKKWPGGSLITRGGASGTAFAKISAAAVLADDLDRFAQNIGSTKDKAGEGSPLELLFDRITGRFGDYKVFANSSPKSESESIIWPAFKTTDQDHFFVKCPRCGFYQAWEFDNLIIPHDGYNLTAEPYILCQNTDCGHTVYERDKHRVLQNWEYRPTSKGLDPLVKGYRVNSLYSMLGYSFTQYAIDWLSACKTFDEDGDDSKKIRHRNTKQAKPWKKKAGRTVRHSALYGTRTALDPLPIDCVILSAGVDFQESPARIEVQVGGHGPSSSYFIEHVTIPGDPNIKFDEEGSPFNELQRFLTEKKYLNSHGVGQPIYCAGLDLGYCKDNVKDFLNRCDRFFFQQFFGVFGKGYRQAAQINFIPPNPTKDIDGFESWALYVNAKKSAFYNQLRAHLNGNKGIYFSKHPTLSELWFKQLTVERENDRGVFEKPYDHAKNEALDCYMYREASFILSFREFSEGVDWDDWKNWNRKEHNTQLVGKKAKIVGQIYD